MFFSTMTAAGQQVAILYVIVAVGFAADKLKLFERKAALLCTSLLFHIVTPIKIVQSFLAMEYSADSVRGLLIAGGCGLILHTVSTAASSFVFNKSPVERASVFKFASAYGNCGYMALPLANALIGAQGVFYCSVVIITFQLFAFSHGLHIMSRSPSGESGKISLKKLALNPGLVSVGLGLPLFLLGVKLPNMLSAPIDYIASLNTPLSMLMFGTYIANTQLRGIFKEWRILGVALLKLVFLPLAMLGLFSLFGVKGTLLTAVILSASAPPANNTVMFAAKYEKDAGLAAQVVSAVSFLSILTIPVMQGLATLASR